MKIEKKHLKYSNVVLLIATDC